MHTAFSIVNQVESALSNESLCVRLRRERERRQIALSSISANTKISVSLFESLERGDVSRWPSGIYRRSFVRAYAQAIGLDPDEIAREFAEQFPDPAEPPPALDSASAAAPKTVESTATPTPATPVAAPRVSTVHLKIAETGRPFMPGHLLGGIRQRLIAVACDGGIVLALALAMFIVFGRFWLPLGIVMLAYYLGGILVLGNTPGVCLWAAVPQSEPHYNQPSDEPRHASPRHSPWHLRLPAR